MSKQYFFYFFRSQDSICEPSRLVRVPETLVERCDILIALERTQSRAKSGRALLADSEVLSFSVLSISDFQRIKKTDIIEKLILSFLFDNANKKRDITVKLHPFFLGGNANERKDILVQFYLIFYAKIQQKNESCVLSFIFFSRDTCYRKEGQSQGVYSRFLLANASESVTLANLVFKEVSKFKVLTRDSRVQLGFSVKTPAEISSRKRDEIVSDRQRLELFSSLKIEKGSK